MAISSQIHERDNCQEFSNGRHVIPFNSVESLAKEKLHTFVEFIYITSSSIVEFIYITSSSFVEFICITSSSIVEFIYITSSSIFEFI